MTAPHVHCYSGPRPEVHEECFICCDPACPDKVPAPPAPREPGCARTGGCCRNILLEWSPRQLREAYRAWRDSLPDVTRLQGIELIYPMLAGRCRGKKRYPSGAVRFVYGPCKHLAVDPGGLAACSIHADRPSLCRGYPTYQDPQKVQMGERPAPTNPGYMRGCGYNRDPQAGSTDADFARLEPLAPEEL